VKRALHLHQLIPHTPTSNMASRFALRSLRTAGEMETMAGVARIIGTLLKRSPAYSYCSTCSRCSSCGCSFVSRIGQGGSVHLLMTSLECEATLPVSGGGMDLLEKINKDWI
jgi:hypothetical protein